MMPTAPNPDEISKRRDARQRRVASRINTVADARRLARSRVPRPVFDYIEGGAGSESTVLANQREVDAFQFRPRLGQTVGVPGPDLTTTVLGTPVAMPLLVSPIGFTRMMDPDGDVAGARAASTAKTVFTLSSMSGHSIDEVAVAADPPAWFQLYFLGGRPGAEQLVERANTAGYGALVVTLDTQVAGNRERDLRYGLSPPLELNRRTAMKMGPHALLHPRWLADLARDRFRLELVERDGPGTRSPADVGGRGPDALDGVAAAVGGLHLAARALQRARDRQGNPDRRRRSPSR
ncbi:MAG: alpha-hydroxy acid oxidase [Acidimicrobiales bacterium]|nr:alpha-hydroxy acid oxidase [Acidimicrobiales bacterium]